MTQFPPADPSDRHPFTPDTLESVRPEGSSRVPDPGMGMAGRVILWLVVMVLFALVVVQQQSGGSAPPARQQASGAPITPAGGVEETAESRMFAGLARTFVRIGAAFRRADPAADVGQFVQALDQQLVPCGSAPPSLPAPASSAADVAAQCAGYARDTIRLAIVAAELQDAIEANRFLDRAAGIQDLPPELVQDITTLRSVYAEQKGDVPQDARDGLVARHDVLGEIALTFGDAWTAQRQALLDGGMRIALFFTAVIMGVVGAVITGCVLLVYFIVRLSSGRLTLRFVPPGPGGSVFLETFGLFLAGFLLIKLAAEFAFSGAIARGETWPIGVTLAGQWLLTPILLWPVLRGMSFRRWKAAVGLSCPRGVGREIAAGVAGYLAGLPILIAAMVITLLLVAARSLLTQDKGPPQNPIVDLLSLDAVWLQFLLAFMAVVWAPINEELLFRGGLYRHFRGILPVLLAAPISAVLFGFMHGYDPLLLLPVMTLGFNFALMREWRGNIVASMTAHALHNGFAMGVMLVGLRLIG